MSAVNPASDANLLLGLVAMHQGRIGRPELVAAVRQWVQGRQTTLGQILVGRSALSAADLAMLDAEVDKILTRHDGDIDQALAEIPCPRTVRVALESVDDADLQKRVRHLGAEAPPDAAATPSAASSGAGPAADGPAVCGPPGQRFRVGRLLVEGNLGSLYLAHDEELDREVVVKQIHARFAGDKDAVGRFNREIRYASELEHTGIVPIYGAGSYSDGRRYYAMRYIKGESLRAAIDRCHKLEGPARLDQMLQLLPRFVAVCRAIGYAHDRGVLHRDIKPENVMLSEDGETIVVDWGLAKPFGAAVGTAADLITVGSAARPDPDTLTVAFQAIGTVAYMSPEAAGGEQERIGPWSDVFSLGATLYHILTGKPAYSRSEVTSQPLLDRVRRCEYPAPRAAWSEVPAELEAVCLKAMARVPEERHRSARALADELEQWLADEPIQPRAGTWTGGAQRRPRRRRHNPWPAALIAAALLAVAGAYGLDVLLHRGDGDGDTELEVVRADLRQQTQAVADAKGAAEEWMKKHELAKAAMAQLAARADQQTAKLDKLGTQQKLLQRRLDAKTVLVKVVQGRFDYCAGSAQDAMDAMRKRLEQPKSKQLAWASQYAEARLQRQIGDLYTLLEHELAEAAYRKALTILVELDKSNPDGDTNGELAITRHNLAWLLATSPTLDKRKLEPALALAKVALVAMPTDEFRLTYGIALYRNNQLSEARDVLWQVKKAFGHLRDPDDYDTCLLFLAMADHRSKHPKEAALWLREAQQRLDSRSDKVGPEVQRFRDEAEQLLAQAAP